MIFFGIIINLNIEFCLNIHNDKVLVLLYNRLVYMFFFLQNWQRETQPNDVFAVVGGSYVTCRTSVIDIYMKYKSSDAQKFIQVSIVSPRLVMFII